MTTSVKILVAEDSADDAKLALRALSRGGFAVGHERVASAEALRAALARGGWDAVLADYRMPGFTGLDALAIVKSAGLDIPFILVSGTVGEETAVAAMKAGASDYVMKKSLARLAPALERELKEARLRAEHRYAQHARAESGARYERQRGAMIGLTHVPMQEGHELGQALREITETAARTLEVARVSVWRYTSDRGAIRAVDVYDAGAGTHSNSVELRATDYPAYFRALAEMDVIAADDAHRDPRTREFSQNYLAPLGIASMMDAPIRLAGAAYGVLCHEHIGPQRRWQDDEKTFSIAVANLVSLAMEQAERAQAERALHGAFMRTVEVATTLSELRDPYTAGHERRVAAIAVAIGAELGFDGQRLEGLRVAGYLHDIGKITIPTEILAKPGKLSAAEFALIKGHAQAGYEVLRDVAFPWSVAEVVLQHHERLDGSGYPQGLKGEAIVLEARIMAVADVVEAMSSHRPYRPGLGIDKALAEIERGRGSIYDSAVADACLRLFREKAYAIPQ